MRVELPEKQWAELRDPTKLTNGQRKPFMVAFTRLLQSSSTANDGAEATLAVGDAAMVTLIESWSLELKLPSEDPAVLDELPIAIYDTLSNECAMHIPDMQQTWAPTTPKAKPSPRPRTRSPKAS